MSKGEEMMELGKKIASLRKTRNITQAQLAEYLSVNPQTISRWEADGGTPDVMLLPKIASFFSGYSPFLSLKISAM